MHVISAHHITLLNVQSSGRSEAWSLVTVWVTSRSRICPSCPSTQVQGVQEVQQVQVQRTQVQGAGGPRTQATCSDCSEDSSEHNTQCSVLDHTNTLLCRQFSVISSHVNI